MTDATTAVTVAIIAAVPPTIVATGAFILGWHTRKLAVANLAKTEQVKIEINGRMTQLLHLTEESAEALGVKKEHERAQKENQ